MRLYGVMSAVAVFALTSVVSTPLVAERITATGTRVEDDRFSKSDVWGRSVELPQAGKVVRVMGGSYGFQIMTEDGDIVGDFLFPQEAVGFELEAGTYKLRPMVCRIHRHHHVEVTLEY